MTLEQLDTAGWLKRQLAEIDEHIAMAIGTRLGVTLGGRYHDDLAEHARPYILTLLNARRAAKLAELAELGVTE